MALREAIDRLSDKLEAIDTVKSELDDVYREMRKIRPQVTAIYDRDVWDRVAKGELA